MDAELEGRIKGAWDAYPHRNAVALMGSPGSGRTAVMAMLKYTATEYWDPEKTGIYATVAKGYDTVGKMLEGMRCGARPGVEPNGGGNEIRITLQNVNGNTDDWEIIMGDTPGEDAVEILSSGRYGTSEARLGRILETGMAHLLFATKYAIMVDCGGTGSRDSDGGRMAAAIRNLAGIKGILPPGCPRGITAAVVFTKADLLPAEYANAPSGDLLKPYKELVHSLRTNGIKFKAFKSYVRSPVPGRHGGAQRPRTGAATAGGIPGAGDGARGSGPDERSITSARARPGTSPAPGAGGPGTACRLWYPDAEYSALISWMIDRKNGGRR
ncbi:MAG: hypothetical protein MPJ06_02440 [Nitrosopumilus sp.]|nr:hypothetical protein [Nitrosopumilus sp.]MDA7942856.1 hypothetical protein [Nitrosopumilus sp.]MDA7998792.1 hypothetical protein [Nitrosopumilus sp.]